MRTIRLLPVFLLALSLAACAGGNRILKTAQQKDPLPDTGPVRLILYEGNAPSDPRKLAIIEVDDAWEITPWGRERLYRVFRAGNAREAADEAVAFLKQHRSAMGTETRTLFSPDGGVIGYELRPLYQPIELGQADVLSVVYRADATEAGKIEVHIDLKESVRELMEGRRSR